MALTITQPKVWYETKRGVGMAMAGIGTLLPMLAVWTGVEIDAVTWGEFTKQVLLGFDVVWNIVGYGLWVWGSFFPTAPLALKKSE